MWLTGSGEIVISTQVTPSTKQNGIAPSVFRMRCLLRNKSAAAPFVVSEHHVANRMRLRNSSATAAFNGHWGLSSGDRETNAEPPPGMFRGCTSFRMPALETESAQKSESASTLPVRGAITDLNCHNQRTIGVTDGRIR